MKLSLDEPKLLTEPITIISELVNEATFKINNDMIELTAMDPANVAMINFKLLSPAFKTFEIKKSTELTVNLEQLKQILKRAKPTDTINLSLDEEKNRLKINIKGENSRTFNISLIEAEEREQKAPNLNFTTRIEIATNIFDEAVEDMSVVAESVSLTAEPKKFIIKSESNLQDAKVEIATGKETKIETEGDASRYSIEYLKKIIKGSKLADMVTLQFGKDYPLKVDYNVKDKLHLNFILAPRVDND